MKINAMDDCFAMRKSLVLLRKPWDSSNKTSFCFASKYIVL